MTPVAEDPGELAALVARERQGREVLVATDFDGTLADITLRPDDAMLREDVRQALLRLVARVRVAILSGRELSDLRARVAIEGVVLAGEHGGDILLPGSDRRGLELTPSERAGLDTYARYADLLLAGTGGEVERKRLAVAAHTRRVGDDGWRRLEDALLMRAREVGRTAGLDSVPGKRVVELRARGASKALGLARVRQLVAPDAYVVALGDDVTDEDLFKEAFKTGGVTIKVGDGETVARHRLKGPAEVAELLTRIGSG